MQPPPLPPEFDAVPSLARRVALKAELDLVAATTGRSPMLDHGRGRGQRHHGCCAHGDERVKVDAGYLPGQAGGPAVDAVAELRGQIRLHALVEPVGGDLPGERRRLAR